MERFKPLGGERAYLSEKDLEQTPSLQDGVDKATEARYRREGAKFIRELANALRL